MDGASPRTAMAIGFGHEGTIGEAFIVDGAIRVVRRRGMIGW